MSNNGNSQILDGSSGARILLKACMDKTVVTKLPVTGQVNAAGEVEIELEAGDSGLRFSTMRRWYLKYIGLASREDANLPGRLTL
jgi:hypothetical protein